VCAWKIKQCRCETDYSFQPNPELHFSLSLCRLLSGRETHTVFHTAFIDTSDLRNITHFGVREQYRTLQANVSICMISGFSHSVNEIAFFWDFTQRRLVGCYRRFGATYQFYLNPLNPELNPICSLLALLGAHHFFHVSRIRVKLLTFRLLMSYIYGAPILDVSRSHTTTQHSR